MKRFDGSGGRSKQLCQDVHCQAGCSGSLQRDEARAVCGANAGLAVLDGLVANGELSKVVANHVRLDLNLHGMGGALVRSGRHVAAQHDPNCHQEASNAGRPELGDHMHLTVLPT